MRTLLLTVLVLLLIVIASQAYIKDMIPDIPEPFLLIAIVAAIVLVLMKDPSVKKDVGDESQARLYFKLKREHKDVSEEEMRQINELLRRMEDRIEALETILLDREARINNRKDAL